MTPRFGWVYGMSLFSSSTVVYALPPAMRLTTSGSVRFRWPTIEANLPPQWSFCTTYLDHFNYLDYSYQANAV